jgi:hypothetical protein
MKYLTLAFFTLVGIACTTIEEVPCKSGHGYLYKNGKEFVCPFEILKPVGTSISETGFIPYEEKITILSPSTFPRRNYPYAYSLSMKVPREYFVAERYTVSLWVEDKSFKPCGEAKETIFYKLAENESSVEYRTYVRGEVYGEDYGVRIFFGQEEMPSYDDWYHVLKVCNTGSFLIKGEIVNE